MMILISTMAIQRITNKIIMTPREIGIMIPMLRNLKIVTIGGIRDSTLRNLKMITLRDLKMIMIVIQMTLLNLKKILLQEEEITTWVLEEIDEVQFPAYQVLIADQDLTEDTGGNLVHTYALH